MASTPNFMRNPVVLLCFCIAFTMNPAAPATGLAGNRDMPANTADEKVAAADTQNALAIRLQADKKTYRQKDEIHFQITYLNQGKKPLRFLVDDTFVGRNFQCRTPDGDIVSPIPGYNTWSPKAGVFTGRPHLLGPGEKKVFAVDVLIDHQYHLVFCNPFNKPGTDMFKEFKDQLKLPSDYPNKYIAAGDIFPVGKPGNYLFQSSYHGTENDRNWTFTAARHEDVSVEHLWIGQTFSNVVEIEIKRHTFCSDGFGPGWVNPRKLKPPKKGPYDACHHDQ